MCRRVVLFAQKCVDIQLQTNKAGQPRLSRFGVSTFLQRLVGRHLNRENTTRLHKFPAGEIIET